jgi:hypothetical protein
MDERKSVGKRVGTAVDAANAMIRQFNAAPSQEAKQVVFNRGVVELVKALTNVES